MNLHYSGFFDWRHLRVKPILQQGMAGLISGKKRGKRILSFPANISLGILFHIKYFSFINKCKF